MSIRNKTPNQPDSRKRTNVKNCSLIRLTPTGICLQRQLGQDRGKPMYVSALRLGTTEQELAWAGLTDFEQEGVWRWTCSDTVFEYAALDKHMLDRGPEQEARGYAQLGKGRQYVSRILDGRKARNGRWLTETANYTAGIKKIHNQKMTSCL